MDDLQISTYENDLKSAVQFNESEPIHYTNSFHSVKLLEELQSLRNNKELCDITLKTDNGTVLVGHKNVLAAASKYFRDMFSSVDENICIVIIKDLDSSALQILIDYIYTGKIKITNEDVKVLLPAANILQLDYVGSACVKYLQTHIDTSNCLSIKEFADLHKCTELMSSSEAFINKHFLEIVKSDEFILLTCEKVIELISCNDIAVPSEEKIFECVINWIKHDLNTREKYLPQLMEHARLSLLASNLMIFKNIIEEPLFKNCPKYNDIVSEVFNFYLLKSVQYFTIPQTIRCKPRQFGSSKKIILLFNHCIKSLECSTEWFDPETNLRKTATKMNKCCVKPSVGVFRDQFVFAMGGMNKLCSQSVSMLDVSSLLPCWVPMADMLVNRKNLGVGVLNDCIYAIGGFDNDESALSNVEVFDVSIQKWRMVTSMNTKRNDFGVGVLNDRLYAVGGYDGSHFLKSVECYDPTLDTWTPVGDLSICRNGVSIGVLNGFMYAIGGSNSGNVEGSVGCNGDGSDGGNDDNSDGRNVNFVSRNCDVLLNESLELDTSFSGDLLNKWKPVKGISERCENVSIGDLDDVMIAVGSSKSGDDDGNDGGNDDNSDGHNYDGGSSYLRSAEIYRPSDGLWSSIADMNLGRYKPGVVALDGLLYVFGGVKESNYFTMEVYDPNTNTWSMKKLSKNDKDFQIYSGVVVNIPPNFTTQ